MLCPVCQSQPATKTVYGISPCNSCQERRNGYTLPGQSPEFTTESIRTGRREYFNSVIQPYRSGELSKEYLEHFGTKGIKPTKKEISEASYVWKDTQGWENRGKSK